MSENCAEEIAKHLVWVAEAGGTIVGGLVLVPSDGFIQLANVAVHPNNRGAGLGRRLLTLAETEAVDRGYAEMRLNTHADMPEIIRLYERNGWLQVSRQGKTIKMRKNLPR
jgi:ribosomal protein S18 acetylase RimI-like enzyme